MKGNILIFATLLIVVSGIAYYNYGKIKKDIDKNWG